jgi:hypothetical protein
MFIRHWIGYLVGLGILIFLYWILYRGVEPGNSTPDIIAAVIQNTISASLTAVSIALPLTVGILGYAVKEKIESINLLFCASVFFLISTCIALWNLFRLPGLVTTLNIANDFKTAVFQIVQLYSLLYGFVYLLAGAWKIVKKQG